MNTVASPSLFAASTLTLLSAVLLSTAIATPTLAATLHVPADYPTIQAGIDGAVAGDTVLVAPGVYTDRETRSVVGLSNTVTASAFLKEGVVLRSEAGSAATTIGYGPGAAGFRTMLLAWDLQGETAVEGFTITGGVVSEGVIGALIEDTDVVFRDCSFLGMRGRSAISLRYGSLTMRECSFEDCLGEDAGGVEAYRSVLDAEDCTFEACRGGSGGALLLREMTTSRVAGNRFRQVRVLDSGNAAVSVRTSLGSPSIVEGNRFEDNDCLGSVFWGERVILRSNLFARNRCTTPWSEVCDTYVSTVDGNTIVDSEVQSNGAALRIREGVAHRNIIAGTRGGVPITEYGVRNDTVFWDNDLEPEGPVPTDFHVDPRFCDRLAGDYSLRGDSPCLPANNLPEITEVIGAFGQGCPGEGGSTVAVIADPVGPAIRVDGVARQAPELYAWEPGSVHVIGCEPLQETAPGIRQLFSSWDDGGAIEHSIVTPAGYGDITAHFDTEYRLSTTSTGNGTVEGEGWFPAGSMTPVTATPGAEYFFSSWTGEGAGSYTGPDNPATVTMNGPIAQTGVFLPFEYVLTMAVQDNLGSVTPATGPQPIYSDVQIEATASYGWEFSWWQGFGVGSYSGADNPATVTMYGPIRETAFFQHVHFPLTMEAGRGGTVTPGSGGHPSFSTVAIQAVPNPGYVFREWIGEGDGSYTGLSNPAVVTMNGPIMQRADFDTVIVPPEPEEWRGHDFTLSLSDTDPHAQTGDPIGFGSVHLWLDCSSIGSVSSVDVQLAGTLEVAAFTPAPGVLATLDGKRLVAGIPSCATGPVRLGSFAVLPPGEGWLCLEASAAGEPLTVRDCNAVHTSHWPANVRFLGVSTDGSTPCVTGLGCEPPAWITTDPTDAPSPAPQIAYETALLGGFPNPFTGATQVRLTRATPGRTRLTIYDVTGRLVRTLLDEPRPAGAHAIDWDARTDAGETVPAGIYFVRLESGGMRTAQKIVRLAR